MSSAEFANQPQTSAESSIWNDDLPWGDGPEIPLSKSAKKDKKVNEETLEPEHPPTTWSGYEDWS